MTRKIFMILLVVVLALSVGIIGCTEPAQQEEEEEEEEVFELTYKVLSPVEIRENSFINEAWFDWLEEESEGRIKVTLLGMGEGPEAEDIYDACRTGVVDMSQVWLSVMPGAFPVAAIGELPLLGGSTSARTTAMVMASLYEKYPEMQEEFPDVKVLTWLQGSGIQIHTVSTPVHTLEDMEGLPLVVMGPEHATAMEALGAEAVQLDFAERFDAVAKGMAEGIECPVEAHLLIYQTVQLCDYTTLCNIGMGVAVDIMNMDTWNSLPPDLQELFIGENAWERTSVRAHDKDVEALELQDELDQILIDRGYEGVYALPEEEMARWAEALEPLSETWVESVAPSIGEATARAMLDDASEFAWEYRYTEAVDDEYEEILEKWGVEI